MKRSRFSKEQIVYALRQAESGTSIGGLCRQYGIAEQTFYAWKKKYATSASVNSIGYANWRKRTAG